MSKERSLNEILSDIQIDLATVKTDVLWLKRIFGGGVLIIGAFVGIDLTGIMV